MECIVKTPLGAGHERIEPGTRISLAHHKYLELAGLGAVELASEHDAREAAAAKARAVIAAAEAEAAELVDAAKASAGGGSSSESDGEHKPVGVAAIATMKIPDALEAIGKLGTTEELLAAIEAENAGKKRAKVLAAIEEREAELVDAAKASAGQTEG